MVDYSSNVMATFSGYLHHQPPYFINSFQLHALLVDTTIIRFLLQIFKKKNCMATATSRSSCFCSSSTKLRSNSPYPYAANLIYIPDQINSVLGFGLNNRFSFNSLYFHISYLSCFCSILLQYHPHLLLFPL